MYRPRRRAPWFRITIQVTDNAQSRSTVRSMLCAASLASEFLVLSPAGPFRCSVTRPHHLFNKEATSLQLINVAF